MTHVPGDAAVGRKYLGCSLPFFLIQALAIMVEDEMIAFAKRVLPGIEKARWVRYAGYAWTFVWISISWPLFTWWQVEARNQQTQPVEVPFSVIGKVMQLLEVHA